MSHAQSPKICKDAHGDASVKSAQLERFRHIIKWHSPETMKTSIKTMNKRQAMKAVLDDEGAQEQDEANAQVAYSKWIETPSAEKFADRNLILTRWMSSIGAHIEKG